MAVTTSAPINWNAAVKAGLASGLIFLIMEMVMVPLFLGGSPWGPPRMIGAIALGEGVLPPPAPFDLMVVMVAMVIHLVLSILFAIILAFILARVPAGMAIAVGAVFGLVLYLVNFYLLPSLGVFPWFENARNWVSIVSHIAFGALAAWFYMMWAGRRTVAV